MKSRDWERVSRRQPCRVCKATSRCAFTLDGRVAKCCHALDGGVGHGFDDVGDFALYFNDTIPSAVRKAFEPQPASPIASAATRHAVYSHLLALAGLSSEHAHDLARRGLDPADVAEAGYATLPRSGRERSALLTALRAAFPEGLPVDVPGLHQGRLPDFDGTLIPVRDADGQILALKIRRDRGEPKYLWLSSKSQGGASSGSLAHAPLGARDRLDITAERVVRLTEGPLKADVATALGGVVTLAIPGAMAARTALPLLVALDVHVVRLAWDADARTNPHVAGGLENAVHLLARELPQVALEVETWAVDPASHAPKGIDDALAAGATITAHAGQRAWRELVQILHDAGRTPRPETYAAAGMEAEEEATDERTPAPAAPPAPPAPPAPAAPAAPASPSASGPGDWRQDLLTTGRGAARKCLPNTMLILRHAPEWAGRLAWDEMALTATLDGEPIGDVEVVRMREAIERRWGFDPGAGDIWGAVSSVAHERPFHPVRDWLDGLVWDGVPRLDSVARDVLGADDALSAVMIRKTFLGAVERARFPGCKVETCTVLIGPQGWRKSTFWRVIAGPAGRWFSDTHIDISNKDAFLQIGDAWIVELGEVEKITSRRGADEIKPFLSSVEDRYCPKYARAVIHRKRGCVFVGSTNQGQFLEDETGSRRYLCITLKRPADIERLRAWGDQLWAEAVAISKACAAPDHDRGRALWCLTAEEEGQREVAAGIHAVADTWTGAAKRWLLRQPEGQGYTTEQILIGAIDLPLKDHTTMHQRRMAKALRALKCDYRRGRVFRDGRRDERDYLWSLTEESAAVDVGEGDQVEAGLRSIATSTGGAADAELGSMSFPDDDAWEIGRE